MLNHHIISACGHQTASSMRLGSSLLNCPHVLPICFAPFSVCRSRVSLACLRCLHSNLWVVWASGGASGGEGHQTLIPPPLPLHELTFESEIYQSVCEVHIWSAQFDQPRTPYIIQSLTQTSNTPKAGARKSSDVNIEVVSWSW